MRFFSIVGGDLRNVELAKQLYKDGNNIKLFGFDNTGFDSGLSQSKTIAEAVSGSDFIIGPLPYSNDEQTLNAPFCSTRIYICDLLDNLSKHQIFISGKIGAESINVLKQKGIKYFDLLEREEMAVLNAIPTAEGAVQIAMEETPYTLHSANVLIAGYGRIGKILSKMLQGIGSNVYIAARKYEDIAWIKSYGYIPIFINDLYKHIGDMDIIFNTIPYPVFNAELLKLVKKDVLIIDLASKPGGFDLEYVKKTGLKTIWALSLPGKVAPISAASYIKQTIYNILHELEG